MTGNSTFFFLMDYSEGESEIFNIAEMLDPSGKCSSELEKTFSTIDLGPREEVISNLLLKI